MADIDPKTLEDFLDRLKETDELYGLTNKTLESYYKNLDKLDKEVKKGIKGYKDQLKALKELDEKLEEVGDNEVDRANKNKLIQQRAELAEKMRQQVLKEASGQAAAALGKGLGKFATEGVGKMTRNLQDNTGGISLATDILGTAIDAGGSAISGIGQVATGAAGAVSMLGKKGQIAGAALSVLGAGLSFLGESGSKLAKFGLEVLSKEVEKTIAAYNQSSAAGAMFADGMTGMRNAASGAGLTVKQFSNVIKNSSGDLAQTGLGVAGAAKKVGDVGKIFDKNGGQVRNQLIKLGYSFDEHAELTATVMANMARAGKKGTAEQIATETEKYAENLRIISGITGEDAKAKVKQVQEQNQILAFQNEIAKLGPDQAAQINAAMATMNEVDQKALRDRIVNHGAVVNQEAAIYEAQNQAARQQNEAIYRLVQSGNATADSVAQVQSQYAQAVNAGTRQMQEIGVAAYNTGDAALSGVSRLALEAQQHSQKFLSGSYEAVRTGVDQQKNANDDLTKGVVDAAKASQQLAIDIETTLTPAIAKFGTVVGELTKSLQKQLEESGLIKKGDNKEATEPSWFKKFVDGGGISKTLGAVGGAATVGGLAASVTGVGAIGGIPLAAIGGVLDVAAGLAAAAGYADGGVTSGSDQGHVEMLHGTEAVVPLPDGRTIPVSMDLSSFNAMNQTLNEILRVMRDNNTLTAGILQQAY